MPIWSLKDDTSSAVRGSLIEISFGGGASLVKATKMLNSAGTELFKEIFVCLPPNKGVILKHIALCPSRHESLSPRKIIPPF